jgi:serine protease Do
MNRHKQWLSERVTLVVIILLSMALGASLTANFMNKTTAAYAVDPKTINSQQRAALYQLQEALTSIVEQTLPSVVSITSVRTVETGIPDSFDEFFRRFFPDFPETPNTPRRQESYGSGVIVRSDGYILTNDHVVGGADKVRVRLRDGREFDGTVMRDPLGDLALVKINATGLPAIKMGDSNKVKPGQWVIAIGSPFGLDQTVTFGVVSAKGRHERITDENIERRYSGLIQTDASINPGNSGGPLINIDGELIGINTLIRSNSLIAGNIGIGFAIPVNTAKYVMQQLIEHGKVVRGQIGVGIDDLKPSDAERYGVSEGALVKSVEVGQAADKAGIQVEDVIVEFDGKKISNSQDLVEIVQSTPPGKQVTVVVVRDKVRKTLQLTVGEAPGVESVTASKEAPTKLGFTVSNITPELANKYNIDKDVKGVVITKVTPGSSAAMSGLEPGLVITRVNNQPVRNVTEFNAATKNLKSGDTIRLTVQTQKRKMLIEFTLD